MILLLEGVILKMWFMPCKVIEPVYESKDDYEIFRQLALRIRGNETEQKFTESKSYMEWIKSLYEKSDGPTLKSFD